MPKLADKISALKQKIHTEISEEHNSEAANPITQKLIKSGELTSDDIENFDKASWTTLRTSFANKLYLLLAGEIAALFLIILLVGYKTIELDPWIVNIFSTAVIAQSFGLVRVIVKNLFDRNGSK